MLSAESTELFVGPAAAPLQIVRVTCDTAAPITITGDGLSGTAPAAGEVPVTVTDPEPGRQRSATVIAGEQSAEFTFTDAEPGWTDRLDAACVRRLACDRYRSRER